MNTDTNDAINEAGFHFEGNGDIVRGGESVADYNRENESISIDYALCVSGAGYDTHESERRLSYVIDLHKLCVSLKIPHEVKGMEETRDILEVRHSERARLLQILNHNIHNIPSPQDMVSEGSLAKFSKHYSDGYGVVKTLEH